MIEEEETIRKEAVKIKKQKADNVAKQYHIVSPGINELTSVKTVVKELLRVINMSTGNYLFPGHHRQNTLSSRSIQLPFDVLLCDKINFSNLKL